MRTNKNQYDKMVRKASPKSHLLKNCLWAFFTGGGTICLTGEVLIKAYMSANFSLSDAKSLASITLVALSAVLTASGC